MNKLYVATFIMIIFFLLASSSSQPTTGSGGYTGAPGDGYCGNCHSGTNSSLDGEITLDGIPAEVIAGQTYNITVTITNPNGNAAKAGFQIVSLRPNITNGGDFTNLPANTIVKTGGGKKYFGHQPAQNFPGSNILSFNVDWTPSMSIPDGEEITFYGVGNIANGNGNTSGDRIVTTNVSTVFDAGSVPLSGNIVAQSPTLCFDSEDGSATVQASGGTPDYNYSWDNGESNSTAVNLSAGLHSVTISDQGGLNTAVMVTIESPDELIASELDNINTSCNGSEDGFSEIFVSGGTGNISYLWPDGTNLSFNSNLGAGLYNVSITDENNCESTILIQISEPDPIDLLASQVDNLSCYESNDGLIFIEATGGNDNYTYLWSNGGTTNSIQDLAEGVYSVEVFDQNNCSETFEFTITQPDEITATFVAQNSSCAGIDDGQATLTVEGGSGNYTFLWSNGETSNPATMLLSGTNIVTITDENECNVDIEVEVNANASIVIFTENVLQNLCFEDSLASITINTDDSQDLEYNWSNGLVGSTINNLASGIYEVTASNAAGCQSNILTIEIIDPLPIQLDSSIVENISCFGENNGLVSLFATGGTDSLSIVWSNGNTSFNINNLTEGTYSYTISDTNSCSLIDSIAISSPNEIAVDTLIVNEILCFGSETGTISIFTSGGTGNLNFLWSNNEESNEIENLEAGFYDVLITDANNCELLVDSIEIISPEPIEVTETVINESIPGANDGSASILIQGGIMPYEILWSNGSESESLDNLAPGTYSYQITDTNNCIYEGSIFVSTGDCSIEATASVTDISCNSSADGSITFNLMNLTAPFQITWNGESTDTSFIDNLDTGTYNFIIIDDAGCSFEINNISISQPDSINISNIDIVNNTSNKSNDGSISITVNGGTPDYTFVWYNENGDLISTSQNLENQSWGNYFVEITDVNGCKFTSSLYFIDFLVANENIALSSISIYPNPASQIINVKNTGNFNILNTKMVTSAGKLINTSIKTKDNTLTIILENIEDGLYFLIIKTDNKENPILTKKIMVVK